LLDVLTEFDAALDWPDDLEASDGMTAPAPDVTPATGAPPVPPDA
jgi:hypothetical protein